MSPEWHAAIKADNPRPKGDKPALKAVLKWCRSGPYDTDTRARWIAESEDSEDGGASVARALRAGGWNGTGLAELEQALETQAFVRAFLKVDK